MIISRNTQFATMEELVLEDFNNALDCSNVLSLEFYEYEQLPDFDEEWIPSELIPDELIGADTDNLTDEQEEMWDKVREAYYEGYVIKWNALLNTSLEKLDEIKKQVENGKYNEFLTNYEEYKSGEIKKCYVPVSFLEWLLNTGVIDLRI